MPAGKCYNVLGTNKLIEKMKVDGLSRKRNYSGRWDEWIITIIIIIIIVIIIIIIIIIVISIIIIIIVVIIIFIIMIFFVQVGRVDQAVHGVLQPDPRPRRQKEKVRQP